MKDMIIARSNIEIPESLKMSSRITEAMDKLVADMIGNYDKQIEEVFTQYLMILAKPPIKGEITIGKLQWRGIRRMIESNSGDTWLEQRGKRISPVIKNGCMSLHLPQPTLAYLNQV